MAKIESWQQEINRTLTEDAMQGNPGQEQAAVKPEPKRTTKESEGKRTIMSKEQRKNVEAVTKMVETTGGMVIRAAEMYGQGKRQNIELKIEMERSDVEIRKLRAEAELAEGKARQEVGKARQEEARARILEQWEREYAKHSIQILPAEAASERLALPEPIQAETVQAESAERD